MPLSDHEQQLLAQLEKQLRTEDPHFAQNISHAQASAVVPAISARKLVTGIIILVVGVAIALAAIFFLNMPWAAFGGVLGFLVMVLGGYRAVAGRQLEGQSAGQSTPERTSAPRAERRRSFMDRVERRWEQRRDGH